MIIPQRVAVVDLLRLAGGLLFVKYFAKITRFLIFYSRVVEVPSYNHDMD